MTTAPDHQDALTRLGTAVRDARTARGWTVKYAAGRSGGDPRSWSTVEKGDTVKPATYRNIAGSFGVSAELVINAAADLDALDALTAALDASAARADDEPTPVDPADLSDAGLIALMRALQDELADRLSDKSGRLEAVEEALRQQQAAKRPQAARIGDRITVELEKGKP